MFRLPQDRRSRIQFALVAGFLLAFYLGVQYAANWLGRGEEFLQLDDVIEAGNLDELQRLIDSGINVNARDPGGSRETPLHVAIGRANHPAVRLLLENGADPNAVSRYEITPLRMAAQSGHMDIARALVDHGAELHHRSETSSETPASEAFRNGHIEVAKFFLFDAGNGDLSAEDIDGLLVAAAWNREVDLVRTFLEAGANTAKPPSLNIAPLLGAVRSGSLECVQVLVEYGFAPQRYQPSEQALLMVEAGASNNPRIISLLLERGLTPTLANLRGETALHLAAGVNAVESARILIENGANLNARMVDGETPLHYAVQRGNVEVLRLLLESGASTTIPDTAGQIPLTLALSTLESPYIHGERRTGIEAALNLLQEFGLQTDVDLQSSPDN